MQRDSHAGSSGGLFYGFGVAVPPLPADPAKAGARSVDGAVYGMTKAAIERFSTGLAAEMFAKKISVNALPPSLVVATPGQMFGSRYTQAMLDASEPVAAIAEAGFGLITGDPTEVTGGIRYTNDVLAEFALTPIDLGMAAPSPN